MSDSDSDIDLEKALNEGEKYDNDDDIQGIDSDASESTDAMATESEGEEEMAPESEGEDEMAPESEGEDEISPKMLPATADIKELKQKLQKSPNIQVCKDLMLAFKSAVDQAHGSEKKPVNMKNSAAFNQIIKLCLVDLVPAINKVLRISDSEKEKSLVDPAKSKVWKRISTSVKGYLVDVLKIVSVMTDTTILTMVLKHIIHLIRFYVKSAKLSRELLKRMISLWASKEESVRVHSMLVIYRITRALSKDYHQYVSKHMYFNYVSNTKFTSINTWPIINFMKRTLVEIFILNPDVAYETAFVYIRQLSIHLRNAVTVKQKEAYKVVYNWQYIHSILLWANLLSIGHHNESLKSLMYPLIQTTIGTINLIPTAKYLPLRFHLVRALIKLSEEAKVFIPLLPLILEVLTVVNFNKKMQFTKTAVDFMCCLKLSKSELQEKSFKECAINQVCDLLVEYFKIHSHTIGFPELALPAIVQLKAFNKICKVPQYKQQTKQVIDKLLENSSFITEKRKNVTFKITDDELIDEWEENVRRHGTPFIKQKNPSKKQKVTQ